MTGAKIPSNVKPVFDGFPDNIRDQLLALRGLVFRVAAEMPSAGEIVETLKWGQPSYLTVRPKTGSTIRLGVGKSGQAALFFHCQTSLVSQFRDLYPQDFDFEGNRALVLKKSGRLPEAELVHCIALALTYHKRKTELGAQQPLRKEA